MTIIDKKKSKRKKKTLINCSRAQNSIIRKLADAKTVVQDIHVSFERINAQIGECLLVVSSRGIKQTIIILRKSGGESK